MKRFCINCGHEIPPEHNVCTQCGTEAQTGTPVDEQPENTVEASQGAGEDSLRNFTNEQPETKQRRSQGSPVNGSGDVPEKRRTNSAPMSKRSKIIVSVVGVLVVALIGFSMWAQSYQSVDSVEKRFTEAVKEGDTDDIQKLVVHEDGSEATKGEATALVKLVEEEGDYVIDHLFTIEPHGKFLGVYRANKAEAIDQLAYYEEPIEGIEFSFNGVTPTDHKKTYYGPFIPGLYEVEAQFKNDYGETTKEGQVTLADELGEEVSFDMDIDVAEVIFYIENQDEIDIAESYIKIGDEKIAIQEDGYSDSVGPLILDGSQQAQTVASTPWGEIESEPFDISESEMGVHADLLSADDFEDVSEVLSDFGESYVEAFAESDADGMENVSDGVKKQLEDSMSSSLTSDDEFYSGEFIQLNIDRHAISPTSDESGSELSVYAEYIFNEAYHPIDEEPDLHETSVIWNLSLNYDDKWIVADIEEDYFVGLEATDTIEGSAKTHSPSDETVKAHEELVLQEEMEDFIEEYTKASVRAINLTDFTYVEDYIEKDSPRYEEAREYIDYLDSKDMTEDFLSTEIESIDSVGDDTWEVTLLESFTINTEDSSDDKDYRTKVVVKKIDDDFYVHELIETDEI